MRLLKVIYLEFPRCSAEKAKRDGTVSRIIQDFLAFQNFNKCFQPTFYEI